MVTQWSIWLVIISAVVLRLLARASIYDDFEVNWCRQRKWRLDWQNLLKPCQNLNYKNNVGDQEERFKTSVDQSEIFDIQLRPAGEYSRFFVQSRTQNGQRKTHGGDSWRVYLDGPSHLAGTVFDRNNGVYEVLFLIMEPGIYKVHMILDYSLCKGLMDPPIDWFRNAHCSGKLQNFHLSSVLFSEMTGYINKPLLSAQSVRLYIQPARMTQIEIQKNIRDADRECDFGCNVPWDGFGRWTQLPRGWNLIWKPYMNTTDYAYRRTQHKRHHHTPGTGIFWVYGDSLSYYFYKSIIQPPRRLCVGVFNKCHCSYNWLYPKNLYDLTETCSEISLDIPKVLGFFREVILRKDMNEESALLFNAGAHYVKTTSFQSYQNVIDALISEIKKQYRGKAIWKSTTAIHGQTADIMGAFRRFTTNHRIQLYNAYANSAMCKNNISWLDFYPISDSYPKGTRDGIHYKNSVFESVIQLLERYFST